MNANAEELKAAIKQAYREESDAYEALQSARGKIKAACQAFADSSMPLPQDARVRLARPLYGKSFGYVVGAKYYSEREVNALLLMEDESGQKGPRLASVPPDQLTLAPKGAAS